MCRSVYSRMCDVFLSDKHMTRDAFILGCEVESASRVQIIIDACSSILVHITPDTSTSFCAQWHKLQRRSNQVFGDAHAFYFPSPSHKKNQYLSTLRTREGSPFLEEETVSNIVIPCPWNIIRMFVHRDFSPSSSVCVFVFRSTRSVSVRRSLKRERR